MENIKMRVVSSMEKCFFDERIEDKPEQTEFIVLKNESLPFRCSIPARHRREGSVRAK